MAIRKQEIEDRLNSWIVFNEKNKELCAWLVQMENKVLQTADVSIEEMIEKLQKVSEGGGVPLGCNGIRLWVSTGLQDLRCHQRFHSKGLFLIFLKEGMGEIESESLSYAVLRWAASPQLGRLASDGI